MKFIADVNVSCEVVRRLAARGLDIVRVPEIMDARSADTDIVAEASRRGAVLISHDQDFSAIFVIGGASGPSLLNIRVSSVEPERLTCALLAVVQATEPDLLAGAIVTLDDGGARVHRLPLV